VRVDVRFFGEVVFGGEALEGAEEGLRPVRRDGVEPGAVGAVAADRPG
jgi:hypothetical protein